MTCVHQYFKWRCQESYGTQQIICFQQTIQTERKFTVQKDSIAPTRAQTMANKTSLHISGREGGKEGEREREGGRPDI